MSKPPFSILPWVLFLICVSVWGSSFILMKKGLVVYSAPQVSLIRIASAGLLLLPFALRHLRYKRLRDYPFAQLFLTSLTGTLVPAFLFAFAQTKLPSSTTGILNSLTPVFVFLQGLLLFGVAFRVRQMMGVIIGLIGAVALIIIRPGGGFRADVLYALLPLLATINYAFNANYVKFKLPKDIEPMELTAVSIAMIGLPCAIALFTVTDFVERTVTADFGWQALGYTLILGLVGTAITKGVFYKLVQVSDAVFATSVSYLIPVVALFWGIVDGEPVGWLHAVALTLVLSGIYLLSKRKSTDPSKVTSGDNSETKLEESS